MRVLSFLITTTLVLSSLLTVPQVAAQNYSKYLSTDVSKLSDAQIEQVAAEIEKRGLSVDEAMEYARTQGASENQISTLKSRINKLSKTKSTSTNNKTGNKTTTTNTTLEAAAKQQQTVKRQYNYTAIDSTIFGFKIFNNETLSFEPSATIPISDTYVVGPGDGITVNIWGSSQQTYELEVANDGTIIIPMAGTISVAGRQFKDAKAVIMSKLMTLYGDLSAETPKAFASINIGKVRNINVNVIGEVFIPGTYSIAGTASLFNALYLSGGPNTNGSYRDIQLIRGGKIVAHLDVYDFILNGVPTSNVALADGDIIMVPTYQKRIQVGGEFKRTGLFEAKEGENATDIIRYAGGFGIDANPKHVTLYRKGEKGREAKDIAWPSKIKVMNGDSIAVEKAMTRPDKTISITEGVFRPGNYEYKPGLTLSELITNAGGLVENAFKNRGVITRLKDDYTYESLSFDVEAVANGRSNIDLKAGDEVLILNIQQVKPIENLMIAGAVSNPGQYRYSENITLGDLILVAGGLKAEASGSTIEIARLLPDSILDMSANRNREVYTVSISNDLKLDKLGNSFVLMPYDIVSIKTMPGAAKIGHITIEGEVKYSGDYSLTSTNDRISDLIERAGGFNERAAIEGVKLYRKVEISKEDRERLEDLALKDSTIRLSTMHHELISINIEKLMKNRGGSDDIVLKDGDRLYVPSEMQIVKVSGEVLNPVSITYLKGKNAKYMVKLSGGFGNNARKRSTYVIYPNGSAAATKNFIFFHKYPKVTQGSEVVVPKKPEVTRMNAVQIVGITSSLVTMATLIFTVTK